MHQRLNLSYLDFFDKDGKEYATLVDRMMALVKTKNGVDIEALQNSQRPVDQALYRRYADVFATIIARQIRTNSVYCGCSRELHLRGLNNKSETIVNEVIQQISQQPDDDKDARSIGSCWGRLFSCRRSSVQNDAQDEAKIPRSSSASVSLNKVGSSVNANNTDSSLTTPLLS